MIDMILKSYGTFGTEGINIVPLYADMDSSGQNLSLIRQSLWSPVEDYCRWILNSLIFSDRNLGPSFVAVTTSHEDALELYDNNVGYVVQTDYMASKSLRMFLPRKLISQEQSPLEIQVLSTGKIPVQSGTISVKFSNSSSYLGVPESSGTPPTIVPFQKSSKNDRIKVMNAGKLLSRTIFSVLSLHDFSLSIWKKSWTGHRKTNHSQLLSKGWLGGYDSSITPYPNSGAEYWVPWENGNPAQEPWLIPNTNT